MIAKKSREKLSKVGAGNIAYYCIQHAKSGRHACGGSAADAYGSMTFLNSSTLLDSMKEVVSQSECGEKIFALQNVLSRGSEDPATIAARNLGWASLRESLTKMEADSIDADTLDVLRRLVCMKLKAALGPDQFAANLQVKHIGSQRNLLNHLQYLIKPIQSTKAYRTAYSMAEHNNRNGVVRFKSNTTVMVKTLAYHASL